jgi:hypothetical protein
MVVKTERPPSRFVLCIHNEGADDLELRKVYQVVPDRAAVRERLVRVIDESGEDYLYPAEYFVPVRLPIAAARELVLPYHNAMQPAAQKTRRSRAPSR